MERNYLKKIIAQSLEDLQTISACCSGAITKVSEIKYLPSNKIFLMSLSRMDKENENNNKKINSIIKFEFIDTSKSININQNNPDLILELITINVFKRELNYEITLLFSNNAIITLSAEIIDVTLEDQKINNEYN